MEIRKLLNRDYSSGLKYSCVDKYFLTNNNVLIIGERKHCIILFTRGYNAYCYEGGEFYKFDNMEFYKYNGSIFKTVDIETIKDIFASDREYKEKSNEIHNLDLSITEGFDITENLLRDTDKFGYKFDMVDDILNKYDIDINEFIYIRFHESTDKMLCEKIKNRMMMYNTIAAKMFKNHADKQNKEISKLSTLKDVLFYKSQRSKEIKKVKITDYFDVIINESHYKGSEKEPLLLINIYNGAYCILKKEMNLLDDDYKYVIGIKPRKECFDVLENYELLARRCFRPHRQQ